MVLKNNVIYHEWNTKGRDLIVGDLHGCYDEFKLFLNLLNFNEKFDICYSVGDLIDRGNNSLDCLSLLYSKWFKPVYANHEQMMVEGLLGNNPNMLDSWIYNGGNWHSNEDTNLLKGISEYIVDNIPYIRVIGNDTDKRINIVHAELYKLLSSDEFISDSDIDYWKFTQLDLDNLVWGRRIIENRFMFLNNSNYNNDKLSKTYVGHTPVETPIEIMNHRYIDTGAVFAVTKQLDRLMTIIDMQAGLIYTMNMKTKEVKSFKW